MNSLIEIVRGDLAHVQRCTLEALVVMEVHNKDIVDEMVQGDVNEPTSFAWLAQLRYYWEKVGRDMQVLVRQVCCGPRGHGDSNGHYIRVSVVARTGTIGAAPRQGGGGGGRDALEGKGPRRPPQKR